MRLDTARRFAMSLPETSEEPHFEASSFRVRGKIFATIPPGGRYLRIRIDTNERRALVAEDPLTFEDVRWGQRVVDDWVQVNLATADRKQVCELLTEAWRRRAPKRILAAFESGGR